MRTLLLTVFLLALTSCGFFESRKAPVAQTPVPALEGNYQMFLSAGGESRQTTAAVRKIGKDFYQIARVSDYGIKYYAFVCQGDSLLFSEELGEGRLAWDAKLGKITITFNKEGNICELTR